MLAFIFFKLHIKYTNIHQTNSFKQCCESIAVCESGVPYGSNLSQDILFLTKFPANALMKAAEGSASPWVLASIQGTLKELQEPGFCVARLQPLQLFVERTGRWKICVFLSCNHPAFPINKEIFENKSCTFKNVH